MIGLFLSLLQIAAILLLIVLDRVSRWYLREAVFFGTMHHVNTYMVALADDNPDFIPAFNQLSLLMMTEAQIRLEVNEKTSFIDKMFEGGKERKVHA